MSGFLVKPNSEEYRIDKSTGGAEAALRAFDYEKNFIVFLCVRMLCGKDNISKVVCEFKNDIEVHFENLPPTSFQIKSTTRNSVKPEEVYDSVKSNRKLFTICNSL